MNELTLVIICASLAVTLMLIATLLQGRQCRRLRRELEAERNKAEIPPPEPPQSKSFAADLDRAERSRREPTPHRSDMSERYRYICAMARQGMSPVQIATALGIGEGEAAQIVRLARLS